jgi:DNA-binding transcriptional ArsR family regulator
MGNFSQVGLDKAFGALADPTRRAILARLEREDAVSVSELTRPFSIKLPAVMKGWDEGASGFWHIGFTGPGAS